MIIPELKKLGDEGERIAFEQFTSRGYELWKHSYHESPPPDFIARSGAEWFGLEVKHRPETRVQWAVNCASHRNALRSGLPCWYVFTPDMLCITVQELEEHRPALLPLDVGRGPFFLVPRNFLRPIWP